MPGTRTVPSSVRCFVGHKYITFIFTPATSSYEGQEAYRCLFIDRVQHMCCICDLSVRLSEIQYRVSSIVIQTVSSWCRLVDGCSIIICRWSPAHAMVCALCSARIYVRTSIPDIEHHPDRFLDVADACLRLSSLATHDMRNEMSLVGLEPGDVSYIQNDVSASLAAQPEYTVPRTVLRIIHCTVPGPVPRIIPVLVPFPAPFSVPFLRLYRYRQTVQTGIYIAYTYKSLLLGGCFSEPIASL